MEIAAKIKESTESTIFTFVDKSMKFSPFFRLRHGSALYLQDKSTREESQYSSDLILTTRNQRKGGVREVLDKIKFFLEDATIPIIGGIIGSFIGMGIAVLLGIL